MTSTTITEAQVGDELRARGLHGQSSRSGEILEILGEGQHQRFRVRWDDGHESIVFPADGVSVIHTHHAARGVSAGGR